jgi:hypothetical protein
MQLSRLAVAAQLLAATAGAAQEPADPAQADIPDADRYGGEILAGTSLPEGTMLWVQGDYGKEEASPALPVPSEDAEWWGAGAWLTRNLSLTLAALRRR